MKTKLKRFRFSVEMYASRWAIIEAQSLHGAKMKLLSGSILQQGVTEPVVAGNGDIRWEEITE